MSSTSNLVRCGDEASMQALLGQAMCHNTDSRSQIRKPPFEFLARRCPMVGRCVQTESRAHALLPRTLFFFDFFDLVERGAQWFTGELTHLQIQQSWHD